MSTYADLVEVEMSVKRHLKTNTDIDRDIIDRCISGALLAHPDNPRAIYASALLHDPGEPKIQILETAFAAALREISRNKNQSDPQDLFDPDSWELILKISDQMMALHTQLGTEQSQYHKKLNSQLHSGKRNFLVHTGGRLS